MATVIIGGLISSTLLEFLVRPALFWKFGLKSARRVVDRGPEEAALDEPESELRPATRETHPQYA